MKNTISSGYVTTHKINKAKDKIKEFESVLSVTPNGLTWRLQQLDISINKVFS